MNFFFYRKLHFSLKKICFRKRRIKEQNIGEEILFVLQKKEIAPEEISMENIFPVGVMGIIENIDEEVQCQDYYQKKSAGDSCRIF